MSDWDLERQITFEARRMHDQLRLFGLRDMEILGLRERVNRDGLVLKPGGLMGPVSLVKMCSRRGLVGKPGHSYYVFSISRIVVLAKEDQPPIGYINKDWNFLYYQAPSLQEALGWALALRREGQYSLSGYDLVHEAEVLSGLIRQRDKQAFYLNVFPAMRREQYMEDCPCWAVDLLWSVGTRTILNLEERFEVTCVHKKGTKRLSFTNKKCYRKGWLTPSPGYYSISFTIFDLSKNRGLLQRAVNLGFLRIKFGII